MKKRGVVNVQVNWIFVLVVGAIILLFFGGLVLKQKTVAETKHSVALMQQLDTIFTASTVAVGTATPIPTPNIRLEFDYNNYYVGDYDTGIAKTLGQSKIVFAPSLIESRGLVTWSQEWNLPFKVTDFLYVTSPNVKYIIVYDDSDAALKDLADEVAVSLPDELNLDRIGIGDISNVVSEGDRHVRFIIFRDVIPNMYIDDSIAANPNADATVLQVHSDAKLSFYDVDKNGNLVFTGEADYVDFNPANALEVKHPSLYGAIFTDNPEMYVEMMKKAFKRLGFLATIFEYRTEELRIGDPACTRLYKNPTSSDPIVIDHFIDLGSAADSCAADFVYCDKHGFDIYTAGLEAGNKKLQQQSCPLIY